MARGMRLHGWLWTLVLLSPGCVEKSARPLATSDPPVHTPATPEPLVHIPAGTAPEDAPLASPSSFGGTHSEALPSPVTRPQSITLRNAVAVAQDRAPAGDLPPPPAKPQSAAEPPRDTAPPPPVTPSTEAPSTEPAAQLRRLLKQAESECESLDSYICRMTRREMVNGSAKPEEVMLFKFRKQPFSIYFKWIGTENKGREVVYVQGRYEGKLHILMSPGGSVMSLAPDSFLIRRSSRHPVTEAGVSSIVEKYAAAVTALDKGQRTIRYLGPTKRPDFDEGTVLEGAEDDLPPGTDPNLPRGGKRQLYFHTGNHLPVLVITKDERGQEVEYYRFDRFQSRVKLDEDDFNPQKLFGKRP